MHLQELAGLERQRLPVDALEHQVAHGGSEHEAVNETEREMVGHGIPEQAARPG
jgi:hypothetical protein